MPPGGIPPLRRRFPPLPSSSLLLLRSSSARLLCWPPPPPPPPRPAAPSPPRCAASRPSRRAALSNLTATAVATTVLRLSPPPSYSAHRPRRRPPPSHRLPRPPSMPGGKGEPIAGEPDPAAEESKGMTAARREGAADRSMRGRERRRFGREKTHERERVGRLKSEGYFLSSRTSRLVLVICLFVNPAPRLQVSWLYFNSRNSEEFGAMRSPAQQQQNNGIHTMVSPDREHPARGNNNSGVPLTSLDDMKGSSSGSEGSIWPKFAVTLTNKEKEEDFLVFKGSKLPQRPKKRAKVIQRTHVCPGTWLCDLTVERYEVREKKVSKKRPRGLRAMHNMDSDSE